MDSRHQIHSVGPFILGKTLGRGATGKVKVGQHKVTGEKVAIKIVNKEFLMNRPAMKKKVEREIAVMKLLHHPHVLSLFDVYQTSKYLFLILEYVEGGELFEYLVKKGNLEPREALHFFEEILQGLEYCHAHLICHRDLKPENLLLDSNNNIKIADFGMASLMEDGSLLETSCGSPHYASPEVIMGKKYDGKQADVWSLGVILYALLTGSLPFDDDNIRQLLSKVKSGIFSMPQYLPHSLKDLLWKMLTVEPEKRITIAEIKRHPWLVECKSKLANDSSDVNHIESRMALPITSFDEDILRNLQSLGWEDRDTLLQNLTSPQYTLQKVFYKLLEERKVNPQKKFLFATQQEERMELEKINGDLGKTSPMQIHRPVNPRLLPQKPETSNSPIIGSSPKRYWFSSFFGGSSSSDTNVD